jgi:hypothetical protein
MKTDFAMFTNEGNAAVKAVADLYIGRGFTDAEELYHCVMVDIVNLSGCQAFEEADDTAVREEIFAYCEASFVDGKSKVNV